MTFGRKILNAVPFSIAIIKSPLNSCFAVNKQIVDFFILNNIARIALAKTAITANRLEINIVKSQFPDYFSTFFFSLFLLWLCNYLF